jgi:hypothetical protein
VNSLFHRHLRTVEQASRNQNLDFEERHIDDTAPSAVQERAQTQAQITLGRQRPPVTAFRQAFPLPATLGVARLRADEARMPESQEPQRVGVGPQVNTLDETSRPTRIVRHKLHDSP